VSPRVALTIGAAFNVLAGLILLAIPAQVLSAAGWPATPDVALVPARDSGTVLIVLGIVSWLARDGTGPALRAVLVGNLVRPVASILVNGWEFASGIMPSSTLPILIGAFAADAALAVIFALALQGSGVPDRGRR
jgi:hypothetical protein